MSNVSVEDIVELTAAEFRLTPKQVKGPWHGSEPNLAAMKAARSVVVHLALKHTMATRASLARDLGVSIESVRGDIGRMEKWSYTKNVRRQMVSIEAFIDQVHEDRNARRTG